jgi:hypothetical protein
MIRRCLYAILVVAGLSGCAKGTECSRCKRDDDCIQGLVCHEFSPVDGRSIGKRCALGDGRTLCRVR